MKKRCIIIPVFNEQDNLLPVIAGATKYGDADVVVIDDGSTDQTADISKKAGTYVIRHPFNMGYGVALQTGYKYALRKNYEFLLQMDGDGQHDPTYIPQLFEGVESRTSDLVIGSRFLGQGDYDPGILKRVGIGVLRLATRLFTGMRMTDPTSGYQCLNRGVLEVFSRDLFPCDYPDANMIITLHHMGFSLSEVPVVMNPNPSRKGMHQGMFTILYYFFKMFLSLMIALMREKDNGKRTNRTTNTRLWTFI